MKKLLLTVGALLPVLFFAIPGAKAQNYSYDCVCLYSSPNGSCQQYTCDSYRQSDNYYSCNNRGYDDYNNSNSRCRRPRPIYYNDSNYDNRYYNNNSNYYDNGNNDNNYYDNGYYNNRYYNNSYYNRYMPNNYYPNNGYYNYYNY